MKTKFAKELHRAMSMNGIKLGYLHKLMGYQYSYELRGWTTNIGWFHAYPSTSRMPLPDDRELQLKIIDIVKTANSTPQYWQLKYNNAKSYADIHRKGYRNLKSYFDRFKTDHFKLFQVRFAHKLWLLKYRYIMPPIYKFRNWRRKT